MNFNFNFFLLSKTQKNKIEKNIIILLLISSIFLISSCSKTPLRNESVVEKKNNETKIKGFGLLQQGIMVEKAFTGKEPHSYEVNLQSNQFLFLVVGQQGVDLTVKFLSPKKELLIESDSPNGARGPEVILFLSKEAGTYQLEVNSSEQETSGTYTIYIKELREPIESDKKLLAAYHTFMEADHLSLEQDSKSTEKAIEKHVEAIELYSSLGFNYWVAYSYDLIGTCYLNLGNSKEPLDYHKKALETWKQISDKEKIFDPLDYKAGQVIALTNVGNALDKLGKKWESLEYQNQSLPLWREVGDKAGEAASLNNIGNIYRDLGAYEKAIETSEKALSLFEEANDLDGKIDSLNNLGYAHYNLGDKDKTLLYYKESLSKSIEANNKTAEADSLNNIGYVLYSLNDFQSALKNFKKAIEIRERTALESGKAPILVNIGLVYNGLGEPEKAIQYAEQALKLSETLNNKYIEKSVFFALALFNRDLGKFEQAITQIKKSIDIIELSRKEIESNQIRLSFSASVRNIYELYIDLLMELDKKNPLLGYKTKALEAFEQARARSFLELLKQPRNQIEKKVDPKLKEQEKQIEKELNNKTAELLQLRKSLEVQKQINTLDKEIEVLKEKLEQIEIKIKRNNFYYKNITQPKTLTLREIQKNLLDKNTLLLEYLPGEKQSYLWAITSNSISSYVLPKKSEIEINAKKLIFLLNNPNPKRNNIKAANISSNSTSKTESLSTKESQELYWELATSFSQTLLEPISHLLVDKNRLVIVCEGSLEYIPFAALPIPKSLENNNNQPAKLIDKYEIINEPSASALALLRKENPNPKPTSKTLAVFADAVFDKKDSRIATTKTTPDLSNLGTNLSQSNNSIQSSNFITQIQRSAKDMGLKRGDAPLERLSFSKDEANAIVSFLPENNYKLALGFDANKEIATSADMAFYRIIHFSSHGVFDSLHPELSFIALSLFDKDGKNQDGFLKLNDIYNLNLCADLVVLSACQTGLGKEIKGEGIVGLTRGFMCAGASRVVASLWSVDDRATTELMKLFYSKMLKEKLSPSAALSSAQRELSQNPKWQHPYYWAAFQLQGEWQ